MRVATYNIRHGRGMDGQIDLPRIMAVLREINADVVALQEVDVGVRRSDGANQPVLIGARLGYHAAFGPNLKYQGGQYGNAVLSRHPIRRFKNHSLPSGSSWSEPRGCLEAELTIAGRRGPLRFYSVHLGLKSSYRANQISSLRAVLAGCSGAFVLGGDLNATSGEPALRMLLKTYRDAFATAGSGRGGTFTRLGLPIRIDYLVVSSSIKVRRARVLRTPLTAVASDHLPVLVEIVV